MAAPQLLERYQRAISLTPKGSPDAGQLAQIGSTYKEIVKDKEGQEWLEKTLDLLEKRTPNQNGVRPLSEGVSTAAWQQKAVMHGAYAGFLVYSLSGWSHSIDKKFDGTFWGVSFPGGSLHGEVYFNDVSDLDGECEFYCQIASSYYAIEFFKDGRYIAVWHCFNLSIPLLGGGGGKGKWSSG